MSETYCPSCGGLISGGTCSNSGCMNSHSWNIKDSGKEPWEKGGGGSGGGKKGGCFVATAVYGDYNHTIVKEFRSFRDYVLKANQLGSKFIKWYYKEGPKLAAFIESHYLYRFSARIALTFVAQIVRTVRIFLQYPKIK